MTKGEAPTTAEQGQAPAAAAATENTAAEAAATEQAAPAPQQQPAAERLNAAEQAAMAAAATEMNAPAEQEAPVQLASAAEAKAEADFDKKKDEEGEDADAQDAPVDLAMAPGADVFEAIAAADGARAVAGAEGEGEASALAGGDGEGVPVIAYAALAAAGIGAAILLASDDENEAPDPGPNPDPEPEPEPEPENVAPQFTSGGTADVDENVDVAATVVYDAEATDADGDDITYSILAEGDDADAFTIDADSGEVRFVASPDFETQGSYTITVVATDSEGNAAEQEVVVTVNDVDEAPANTAPEITSDATAEVAENIDVATVVYTAAATDAEGDDITFSLSGDDAAAFTIDADTGEVRFVASPDFEVQPSYDLTVTATDAEGAASSQDVVVSITDVVEPVVIDLDAADTDGNPNTANPIDAGADAYLFTDDADLGSYTTILNFEEGDLIEFSEGATLSFSTGPDDANDLQVIVNNGGVVSEVLLDDVLADGAPLIYDEATAEAAIGFDFISIAEPAPIA